MKKIHAKNLKQIMRLEGLISSGNKEKLDKRPLLLQVEEKIRHSDKKILGIKENAMQEQGNLEEKKNIVLDLKDSLKNLESKNEDFTRLMAQRSLEFQQLEGKNLEQYQKLKKIANQESVKEREDIAGIERTMGLIMEREKDLKERSTHVDAKVETLLEDSRSIMVKKEKLIKEIDSVAKELHEEQIKNATSASEKKRLRQIESELQEKLNDANNRLFQARVDKKTSEKETKFKETLSSLKRIYPGKFLL
jgi:structural maintenance of chromosome 1